MLVRRCSPWPVAAAVATLAALVLAASPASAQILNAEAILPPGQSGFVSTPGVLQGTGSPHLYDQLQMFIDFKRKPLGFDQGGDTTSPRPGVSITRDAFGVPDVHAGSETDAWWGAGYAIAQDRLFQLDAFRHATAGRLSELTGKSSLDADLIARRDYYSDDELDQMFAALPVELQQHYLAYRDGVNAWITHVGQDPLDLPGEYVATATALQPYTTRDLMRIGVYLARTVPSGDGKELRNLRALQLSGPRVLDALLPRSLPHQLSTVPRSSGLFSQGRALSKKKAAAALARSLKFAATLPAATSQMATASARKAAGRGAGSIGRTGGSSAFAVREPGNRALLFNGPQLGFSAPELFTEVELHAPGLDVRGVTAAGAPVVAAGHDANVAWGVTSGLSDDDDLYAEQLVPGHPDEYMYKGAVRKMDCHDERFDYKSPPTNVLSGGPLGSGSVTKQICRTVHGPVQAVQGDVAYARRYAIWGRELDTLVGLNTLDHASSINDVSTAASQVSWNENITAADSQGNIGYWHPGLIQLRNSKWDERLPLPGTGDAEWGGFVPRAKLPHVIDPKQGWVANWNNLPSQGWTSGDGESSERIAGQFHRVGWLMRLVRDLHAHPSFDGLRGVIEREGTTVQQRPLASARLRRADTGATGPAKTVLDTILAWDGSYARTDAAGTVDPGVAAWEAFEAAGATLATNALGPGADLFERQPGTSHVFDATDRDAYALRTLGPQGYRDAAADAGAALAKRFGTTDPARWREPRRMYKITVQGAEQAKPLPFFDRGTWEQLLEVGP